jgi:hypothetical protein
MFHVELRQFPHVARAYNLAEEDLQATIVVPWTRGEVVELGEHRWAPERATLTVYEGPRLREDEISMGRGWPNATRKGTDVTARILDAARASEPATVASLMAEFKLAVLAQCAAGRTGVHQVLWLANAEQPGRRASERLALAEQAIWELLHERRLTMLRPSPSTGELETVPRDQWQAVLLDWATWSDPSAPSVQLEGVPDAPAG